MSVHVSSTRNRRFAVIASALVFLLVLATGIPSVLAFLSKQTEAVENVFSSGSVSIEVRETFDPPEELSPGIEIEKNVKIANTDGVPCYVRAFCELSDSRIGQWASLDYNVSDWTEPDADGWRYYKHPLAPGQETVPLITKIAISDEKPSEGYIDFDIPVVSEAVQAKSIDGSNMSLEQAWGSFDVETGVK